MSDILIFDHDQRETADVFAFDMRGSAKPVSECIEFGREWKRVGPVEAWIDRIVAMKEEETTEDTESETEKENV